MIRYSDNGNIYIIAEQARRAWMKPRGGRYYREANMPEIPWYKRDAIGPNTALDCHVYTTRNSYIKSFVFPKSSRETWIITEREYTETIRVESAPAYSSSGQLFFLIDRAREALENAQQEPQPQPQPEPQPQPILF